MKIDKQPTIGSRIRKARNFRKMTQNTLAKEVGLLRNAVSQYELGYYEPSLAHLVRIADTLDISMDYLCGRTTTVYLDEVRSRESALLIISDMKMVSDILKKTGRGKRDILSREECIKLAELIECDRKRLKTTVENSQNEKGTDFRKFHTIS